MRYYARSDWSTELQNLCSHVLESGYVTVLVIAKESHENFSNFDLMSAFGLEMSDSENQNQINQTLNKRMKTKVQRKTGPPGKEDLP